MSLQNEKEKLAVERDSALAKAEEQALYMASINLDKANRLVKEAVAKVDSLQDIPGAIAKIGVGTNKVFIFSMYVSGYF